MPNCQKQHHHLYSNNADYTLYIMRIGEEVSGCFHIYTASDKVYGGKLLYITKKAVL